MAARETAFLTLRTLLFVAWGGMVLIAALSLLRLLDPVMGFGLPAWLGTPGIVLAAIGLALILVCCVVFIVSGRGTPLVIDPPQEFVAVGPYRYVRNPIYVGEVLLLIGLACYLRSFSILLFALAWFLILHIFVLYYEEPDLKRKFGPAYERYCATVGRWLPRRPPWSVSTDSGPARFDVSP